MQRRWESFPNGFVGAVPSCCHCIMFFISSQKERFFLCWVLGIFTQLKNDEVSSLHCFSNWWWKYFEVSFYLLFGLRDLFERVFLFTACEKKCGLINISCFLVWELQWQSMWRMIFLWILFVPIYSISHISLKHLCKQRSRKYTFTNSGSMRSVKSILQKSYFLIHITITFKAKN